MRRSTTPRHTPSASPVAPRLWCSMLDRHTRQAVRAPEREKRRVPAQVYVACLANPSAIISTIVNVAISAHAECRRTGFQPAEDRFDLAAPELHHEPIVGALRVDLLLLRAQ